MTLFSIFFIIILVIINKIYKNRSITNKKFLYFMFFFSFDL